MADLISVADAQAIIGRMVRALPAIRQPLSPALVGSVLAEDIHSDLDSPPFDKALMDGYAIQAADLATGQAEFEILEEVTAGRTPTLAVASRKATRIMTGAPIPTG